MGLLKLPKANSILNWNFFIRFFQKRTFLLFPNNLVLNFAFSQQPSGRALARAPSHGRAPGGLFSRAGRRRAAPRAWPEAEAGRPVV